MNETKVTKDGNVLTLERTIDASKDKVWDAWTVAEIFSKWWGPRGWDTTVKHLHFTPGGDLLYGMKCNDKNQGEWYGQTSWGKSVYDAINPKDSFSYTDYFCDADGNPTKDMPTTKVTIQLEEVDGKTKMTNTSTYTTEADLDQVLAMGMEEGIKQTLDRLDELFQ